MRFEERGARITALGPFLKAAVKRMSPGEREAFEKAWIDRLLQAAKESGAVMPSSVPQAREPESIIVDSDDDMPLSICTPSASVKQTLAPDTAIPSTSDISLVSNTQATLATMGWQPWLPGAKETHLKKAAKDHHETAAETLEKKERQLEGKRERERILAAERQRRITMPALS
ncbi:hypothetical protein DFH08DRAFT_881753 [Mycena albidolilacea]|uniref:Uncharacterized protein n=1 Tax=Mycena albidolilacea TaxID=1033008 RepID=A0AAD6ZNY5_9AGAR|nr:hypothetical protein DFH08DRAFT_881753 [Mycena albidolilacea]